jgi:CRISPR-associated endonuclease/helicase Cas3
MESRYFAHSANAVGERHLLRTHLQSVATMAYGFAANTPWADEAQLAGLLHDLGKYGDRFQARLRGEESGLDHWSQGAWLALSKFRAVAAALAIQGHHVGLQRGAHDGLRQMQLQSVVANHPQRLQLSEPDADRLLQLAQADGLQFRPPAAVSFASGFALDVAGMLDARLLFSCLVDADFLDTEAHFNGDAEGKHPRPVGPVLDAQAALEALGRHMDTRRNAGTRTAPDVRAARESLWRASGLAALVAPNLFALTAPTGSGKTLAMLRFALEHARHNKLKRIVLAVPFLTVIEQTAREYRQVFADFPPNFVLEHHSLAGLGEESALRDAEGNQERQRRLLAENWDAPVVITTNVQLLESLFSNRPSTCRKLHNLMESVVLFDEAQSLPQHLAVPTLAALSHLSAAYRSSVVFATATQPAFEALDQAVTRHAVSGWKPVEVVPEHRQMFETLRRVRVAWPIPGEKRSWADLALELRGIDQVLVVVNLKRHALALFEEMASEPGMFHISTNLCAEHRRAVLRTVRARLLAGQTCRLISTQCIEAGVDVDFPALYRALAPLDAIAQAAGRCNREGRLNQSSRFGEVVVFEPAEDGNWRRSYPTRSYFQATQITRGLLAHTGSLDIGNTETFQAYYRALYDTNDPASQSPELTQAMQALDFTEVARRFRLIEQEAVQVLVPWADRREQFDQLRREAYGDGISAEWMRRAQGLAVSVYRSATAPPAWAIPAKLRWNKQGAGVSDEWFILEGDYYDETVGLNPPDGPSVFIA